VELGQETLSIVAVAAAAVAVLSLAWNVALSRRLKRLRSPGRRRASRTPSPAETGVTPDTLLNDVEQLVKAVDEIRDEQTYAIQRVGMIRFDAFQDMGGKLSFAAAMLDGDGSGIVLSSINGRTDTRIYAKPVEQGVSRYNLSEEETEAIRRALSGGRS